MKRHYLNLLVLVFLALTSLAYAQNDGSLDNSFYGNGKHTFTFHTGSFNQVYDVDQADPNSFYILSDQYITKIDSGGVIDSTFGTNGVLDVSPIFPNDIAIGNNRLYIGGWDANDNAEIQCFLLDGTPDNTFGTNSISNPTMPHEQIIYDMQIDPVGRLVIAGRTNPSSVNHDMMIFRMLSDGSVDSSFGANGLFTYDGVGNNDEIWKVGFQSDGKLICAGELGLGFNSAAVIRLNTDGTLDNTFGSNGRFSYSVIGRNTYLDDVLLLDDDRIRITGAYDNTTNYKAYVIGLTANGGFDNTFAGNGRFTHPTIDRANALMLQPDGKILVAALDQVSFALKSDFAIMRLNANGTLDNLWGGNGSVIYDIVGNHDNLRALFHLSSGKILGVGSTRDDPGNRFIGLIRMHNSVVPGCVPQQTSESLSICPGDSAFIQGQWTVTHGAYPQTLTGQNGCDSIHTVQLNQSPIHSMVDVQRACDFFTWIDGVTYTQSTNLPTLSYSNVNGCDSTFQLDLIIDHSDSVVEIRTACSNFTWIDGTTYTQSTDQASITLQNTSGCDSLVYLDLTILTEDSTIDLHASCTPFTWIDGNTYNQSIYGPSMTLTNVQGCDSLVILNLTIDSSVTVTETIEACGSHSWIDGVTYFQSTFGPSVALMNINGCDSVVTLDLTVNPISSVIDSHVACGHFTWVNGVTYTQSISGETLSLTSSKGCDSTLILDLIINNVDTGLIRNGQTLYASPNADSWSWIDCNSGQLIVGANDSVYLPVSNGSYAAVVSNNGCVDTTRCIDILDLIVTRPHRALVKAYPNPFESTVQLDLPLMYDDIHIEILNARGSRVMDIQGSPLDLRVLQIEHPGALFILKIYADGLLIHTSKLIRN